MVLHSRMIRLCLSTLLFTSCALSLQIILDLEQDQSPQIHKESHTDSKAFDLMMGGSGMSDRVACEGSAYMDPKNGISSCCSLDTFWTIDKDHPNEGKCCPAGTSYSFDSSVQNGDCCLSGQLFVNKACRSIIAPANPLQTTSGPCPTCGSGNVCSYYGNLGIRYNHCYTMKDSGGNEIRRSGPYYINQDLDYSGERGVPFRICASSTNCSVKMDQYVPEGGSWFQLDEQGVATDSTNDPAWMIFVAGVQWLEAQSTSALPGAYNLANFTGQGTCIFGECAICIKFGSATALPTYFGLSTYPGGAGSGLLCVQNSRQCKPFYYEETSCIAPSNVAPN